MAGDKENIMKKLIKHLSRIKDSLDKRMIYLVTPQSHKEITNRLKR